MPRITHILTLVALAACSSSPTPPSPAAKVASITIAADSLNGDSISIVAGDTARLHATALDAQGKPVTGVTFVWTSSDTTVATVSATGLVSAMGPGDADVSVSVSATDPKVKIVVVPRIMLSPKNPTVDVGGTVSFSATLLHSRTPYPSFTWKSSNPAVATIDGHGVATGVSKGTTRITATAAIGMATYTGSTTLTVTQCGGINSVQAWDASITATFAPPDFKMPDASVIHINQTTSIWHTTLGTHYQTADSTAWATTTPSGTGTVNNATYAPDGTLVGSEVGSGPLQSPTALLLETYRTGSGCRYTIVYYDYLTYTVTAGGGTAPETKVFPVAQTVVDAPLPAPGPGGAWTLTGNVQLPASSPISLLNPLSASGYLAMTGLSAAYVAQAPLSYANAVYTMTSH